MHLSLNEQNSLAKSFPFKWTQTSWKYLGIYFPLQLEALKEANYQTLVKSIRKSFKDWNLQKFSWTDRLQIIKTFILPRFIFLFRTLPIELTAKEIHSWQTLCNLFLWSFKAPRISYQTLKRPRELGRIGLPDLQLYYDASQLASIFPLLQGRFQNCWTSIEEFYGENVPLMDTFWQHPKERPQSVLLNPFLLNSSQIWGKYRNKLASDLSMFSSVLNQSWFPPLADPAEALKWHDKELEHICDLFHKQKILEKQTLSKKLDRESPSFKYLQLQHLLDSPPVKQAWKHPQTFEQLLVKKGSLSTGILSLLYKILIGLVATKPLNRLKFYKFYTNCYGKNLLLR